MIKEILIMPIIGMIVISFAIQLAGVAESTSQKAFTFTQEMDNAMDCATRGIPISVCSPSLMGYNFTPDAEEFKELNREYITQLTDALNNITINNTNSSNITYVIIG